jgi:hypothetical protein
MATRTPVTSLPALPTRQQWLQWIEGEQQKNPNFIPPNQLTLDDVREWQEVSKRLQKLRGHEMMLRQRIYAAIFPSPKEGANKAQLPDGTLFEATHKIDRKVDEAALAALKQYTVAQFRSFLTQLKIEHASFADDAKVVDVLKLSVDKLIKYEPDLAVREYRTLTAEQAAVFDTCITAKPGSPSMTVEFAEAGNAAQS